MKNVLIIEDEITNRKHLSFILKKYGYNVSVAENGTKGLQIFNEKEIDLVFCDFQLPDMNGSRVLQSIKKINPDTPIIIYTGYANVKTAVHMMKLGAFDYLLKPLVLDEVLMVLNKAVDKLDRTPKAKDDNSRNTRGNKPGGPKGLTISDESIDEKQFIFGESSSSKYVQKQVELVAKTNYSVIVYGESGTGKESIANSIHQFSKRKDNPFIAVDCGALQKELSGSELFGHEKGAFTGAYTSKPGQFELANGGTIFLDEIGNLSYDIQTSILRAIQERKIRRLGSQKETPIDVRIIVASNQNLKSLVDEGKFREDLYHRLNVFSINLQPLRERKEDLSLFATYFLKLVNKELDKQIEGISLDAFNILLNHKWPGNLRELNNVIRRAALLTEENMIQPDSLPPELISHSIKEQKTENPEFVSIIDQQDLKSTSDKMQEFKIKQTLKMTNNNKSKAARLLGIDRKTLYNKLKEYGIKT